MSVVASITPTIAKAGGGNPAPEASTITLNLFQLAPPLVDRYTAPDDSWSDPNIVLGLGDAQSIDPKSQLRPIAAIFCQVAPSLVHPALPSSDHAATRAGAF